MTPTLLGIKSSEYTIPLLSKIKTNINKKLTFLFKIKTKCYIVYPDYAYLPAKGYLFQTWQKCNIAGQSGIITEGLIKKRLKAYLIPSVNHCTIMKMNIGAKIYEK